MTVPQHIKKWTKAKGTWSLDRDGKMVFDTKRMGSFPMVFAWRSADKFELHVTDGGEKGGMVYVRTNLTKTPKAADE
jgi:hypothetical protein